MHNGTHLVQASMWSGSTLVMVTASCLFSTKPLPDLLLTGSLGIRAGVNSGIGIGIDANSNSRNWNWKGIELITRNWRNWFNSFFLSSIPFDFFALFFKILAELLNQCYLKPFWIQLTKISLDKYITLYDNLSIKWILRGRYWLHL